MYLLGTEWTTCTCEKGGERCCSTPSIPLICIGQHNRFPCYMMHVEIYKFLHTPHSDPCCLCPWGRFVFNLDLPPWWPFLQSVWRHIFVLSHFQFSLIVLNLQNIFHPFKTLLAAGHRNWGKGLGERGNIHYWFVIWNMVGLEQVKSVSLNCSVHSSSNTLSTSQVILKL